MSANAFWPAVGCVGYAVAFVIAVWMCFLIVDDLLRDWRVRRKVNLKKSDLVRLSTTVSGRSEAIDAIEKQTGERLSVSDFESMARRSLPKESYYQRLIMDSVGAHYRGHRLFMYKAAAGPYSRQGIPDIWGIIDGRVFALEVKRPFIGEPTGIQMETISEINRAGGYAAVVHNPNEAYAVIDRALRAGRGK